MSTAFTQKEKHSTTSTTEKPKRLEVQLKGKRLGMKQQQSAGILVLEKTETYRSGLSQQGVMMKEFGNQLGSGSRCFFNGRD